MGGRQGDIFHTLPGGGGDESWLARMQSFDRQETLRQARFNLRHWPELEPGRLARRPEHRYPHILPEGHQEKAYYQSMASPILNMLRQLRIALHTESLNLKSSQSACLNFLFPLRQDPGLAASVLSQVLPGLVRVGDVEFEYTGPPEATRWLGEPPSGGRGRNRTSVDAAVFWEDDQGRRRATLVEWKYTEPSYGSCSAFSGGSHERKADCLSLDVTAPDPARSCYVAGPGRNCGRHYWGHMREAGIQLGALSAVPGCPFRGPLYQLMRQQQLAAYLTQRGLCDIAGLALMSPEGNAQLLEPPPELSPLLKAGDTVLSVWNRALRDVPPARHITCEGLGAALDAEDGVDPAWRAYLRERYGV